MYVLPVIVKDETHYGNVAYVVQNKLKRIYEIYHCKDIESFSISCSTTVIPRDIILNGDILPNRSNWTKRVVDCYQINIVFRQLGKSQISQP